MKTITSAHPTAITSPAFLSVMKLFAIVFKTPSIAYKNDIPLNMDDCLKCTTFYEFFKWSTWIWLTPTSSNLHQGELAHGWTEQHKEAILLPLKKKENYILTFNAFIHIFKKNQIHQSHLYLYESMQNIMQWLFKPRLVRNQHSSSGSMILLNLSFKKLFEVFEK